MRYSYSRGFTLVELMVVVAIIGVLASVAVPTFRKYNAKARSVEAKLSLSAAYTAEQTIYTDFGTYALCMGAFGLGCEEKYNNAGSIICRTKNNHYSYGFDGTTVVALQALPSYSLDPASWGDHYLVDHGAPPECISDLPTMYMHCFGAGNVLAGITEYSEFSEWAGNEVPGYQELTQSTFSIPASGYVVGGFTTTDKPSSLAHSDTWTINEKKELIHRRVGY
jgi:prepilin-type N-terminal cleavage/methylation domain-containing protein